MQRIPGPVGQELRPDNINEGTLRRSESFTPGPVRGLAERVTGISIIPKPKDTVAANQGLFIAHEFQGFPGVFQTKAGWLIGTYGGLRSFIRSMKEDLRARESVWADLQQRKDQIVQARDKVSRVLLIRCGRREGDNIYDDQGSLKAIESRTGPSQAARIDQLIDSKKQARVIIQQGLDHTSDRTTGTVWSRFDKNLKARVMDVDPSADYHNHWSQRQFEAHHIVEASLAAVKEAEARFPSLNRSNSLCVLVCAELHQRFFTSALAIQWEIGDGQSLSERDRLNQAKTKEAFKRTYDALYGDPTLLELRQLAGRIIESLFA